MPEEINKMPEFYMIFARKIFFPIFLGVGASAALPPPRLLRLWQWPTQMGLPDQTPFADKILAQKF